MRASIIITLYNSQPYLEACLRSLRRAVRPDDELILVDNASSDGSVELDQCLWPGAKLIRNSANRGFAAACNQGALIAEGDFLVFLNQDTRVEPGWLDGLLEAFDQSPRVGLVTSKLLLMSRPQQIHMAGQDVHFTGLTFGRGFLQPLEAFSLSGRVSAVSGASFAIRRELWQQLGGFDPGLFMYYEETDLCWRARLAGYDSLYAPASVAYHDYRPGQVGTLALYYTRRNRYILLLKSYRWATLLMVSPSLLLAGWLEWALAARIGRRGLKAKWDADAWLAGHLGEVIRSRRGPQKGRLAGDLTLLESCSSAITPLETSWGKGGKVLAAVASRFFQANLSLARALCRAFHL